MINRAQVGPELRTRPLLPFISLPFVLVIVPTLLLEVGLSVYRRGVTDLGLDEALSFFIASKPPLDIVKYSVLHVYEHPPGYYLLLHLWLAIAGRSEFALRFLSGMAGLLSVALVATLARRWFGPRIAFLAALLMALQPLAFGFGHNVRMYSWLIALGLLQLYLLVRAIEQNRRRDWLLFLAVMAVAIGVHYLAAASLLAYALFLALRWRHIGACRWRFLAVLLILIGLPVSWALLSPGPRQSLFDVAHQLLSTPWRPDGLAVIYAEWALGPSLVDLPRVLVVLLAAAPWLLFAAGILAMARPARWERRDLQLLLALVVLVPPLAGSLLLSAVVFEPAGPSRHHSAMLGCFVLGIALGVDALFRYRRTLGVLVLAALVTFNAFLLRDLVGQGNWRPFSPPMDYIAARSRPNDKLAFTYFFDWVQAGYYNAQGLPIVFIPSEDKPLSASAAQSMAAKALSQGPVLWLVLYPTASYPVEVIEQAFNRLAFPAGKVSFPANRGVVQYFRTEPMTGHQDDMAWETGIRLANWQSSASSLPAGDALRLLFEWQRPQPLTERAILSLDLVGSDGQVWARRTGEPCNGWCKTTDWPSTPVMDRQALYIPPDVPPGDYMLRLAWLTPAGEPILGHASDQGAPQLELPLMPVHVDPPTDPVPGTGPEGRQLDISFSPGLALYAVQFADPVMRSGTSFVLPTQWQVSAPLPALTARLHLRQSSQDVTLDSPLGPAWYPSQAWTAGRIVRAQPRFALPGTLSPGEHAAGLGLVGPDGQEWPVQVPLGTLTVQDRPRRFDVPAQGSSVDIGWQEGIRLARVDAPAAAAPGGQLPITLIWQAGRPTGGNWKVFVHLAAADGQTVAQNDAYPAGDQAPTPTWQPGEVVIDEHILNLPGALPPGEYRLQVGLYDEKTGARLPLHDNTDTFVLPAPVLVGP